MAYCVDQEQTTLGAGSGSFHGSLSLLSLSSFEELSARDFAEW
jgi:hypothetical protein